MFFSLLKAVNRVLIFENNWTENRWIFSKNYFRNVRNIFFFLELYFLFIQDYLISIYFLSFHFKENILNFTASKQNKLKGKRRVKHDDNFNFVKSYLHFVLIALFWFEWLSFWVEWLSFWVGASFFLSYCIAWLLIKFSIKIFHICTIKCFIAQLYFEFWKIMWNTLI